MRRFSILVLVLFSLIVFAGCTQQKKVSTAPEQAAPKAVETEKKVEAPKAEPKVETMAVKAAEMVSNFTNVLFDFDKYNVRADAKSTLKGVSDFAISTKEAKIVLEGNCDERGTNEYNLALGEKRAKAVRDYLVSIGVSKNMLSTISYGKEKPLCTEKTEDCWQQNRRVEFKVSK